MWPDSEKTDELLAGALEGDAEAVNRLLQRHRAPLRRLVDLRLDRALSRRVDASDVVQDVFLEASQRLQEYLGNPVMPFHLWIRQIARDRVIDLHRRHRVAARRSVDRERPLVSPGRSDRSTMDLAAELCDRELTPAGAAAFAELQRRFAEAVESLDEQDREVIEMRHFEHLTNSDVAQALGLSAPAASMRYMRAMRRLRACLEDEDETPSDSDD